jgi:hypothetical protein
MGKEAMCTVRFGKQVSLGKALLETSEILFRGDFRLKIQFAAIKSVKASGGQLRVQIPEGLAVFELGPAAEKWCEKILHPKSLMEKLGVKTGAKVSLLGDFDAEFLREIKEQTTAVTRAKVVKDCEWIFLAADSLKDLSGAGKIANSMQGAAALWIIYPKGKKEITENDVIAAGRKAGLKDVKVVGFSATHTGLKFVIPLAAR